MARNHDPDDNYYEFAGTVQEFRSIQPPNNMKTYADSGASVHIFQVQNVFAPMSLVLCAPRSVVLPNNVSVQAEKCREVLIEMQNCGLRLTQVLWIPSLGYILVSMGRLADSGIESWFGKERVELRLRKSSTLIGTGFRNKQNGMYIVPSPFAAKPVTSALISKKSPHVWHRRLAHLSDRDLNT